MPRFARTWVKGLAVVAAVAASACGPQSNGCLAGDDGTCVPPSPCAGLRFSCAEGELELRRITSVEEPPLGLKADAARGDILLRNGQVSAVLGAVGTPRALAPSGGGLIDLVPNDVGAVDELNQVFQAVGILPDDAARYTSVDFVDGTPEFVAAVFRGHLDLRPQIEIVTRYELRSCEPGLRVRSEIYHGARDPLTVFPADALFWGDRGLTPFVPAPGGGYAHPELDLETIGDAFRDAPFVAADAHTERGAAYAVVACDGGAQSGFHSETLSAVGHERTVLMPGDSVAFERFIAVAKGPGQQRVTDVAFELRAQLFGEATSRVAGRVNAGGGAASGERRVSLLFSELLAGEQSPVGARQPWAEAVPDDDGEFELRLPRGRQFVTEVFTFGQSRSRSVAFETNREELRLADLEVSRPSTLNVQVTRADGSPLIAELVLVPRAPTRVDAVRGSLFGVFAEERCAPYLGPPHGGSPACNRVLVDASGRTRFDVPPGDYYVYATHGPFWSLARQAVSLAEGTERDVALSLEPLPLLPEGVLSADFHVHGGASFDSSLPDRDRALSFVAMGVDVIAATDHDVVSDYTRALEELGLEDRVRVMPGVETTGQVLFLRPPGSDVPKVIGHFNFWPLRRDPSLPRNGAPDDERQEPGALFDRVARLYDGAGVAQLNHPFLPSDLGRDTGYLAAIEYDPRRAVPSEPDGSNEGELARRSAPGGRRNLDFDAQEVMNGTSVEQMLRYRAGWFSFLNQGILRAGTANSDSHTLAIEVLGYPRNLVFGGHTLAGFDRERFNQSVRHGEMVGSNGPVLQVCFVDAAQACAGPSLGALTPTGSARLHVTLTAAPFVPVEELRFVVNGVVKKTTKITPKSDSDPFGTSGLLRFEGEVELSELALAPSDAWLVVEAGLRLPLAGDLEDDDGLVDTTDNNGDGTVDTRDSPGEFREPGRTTEDDPRFHIETLAPGAWPTAFTNPFLIDWRGDGWQAPGLP